MFRMQLLAVFLLSFSRSVYYRFSHTVGLAVACGTAGLAGAVFHCHILFPLLLLVPGRKGPPRLVEAET